MFPSIEYRLSQQKEWRNDAYIFWKASLQCSIENRQRVLTFFAVEDVDVIRSHSGLSEDQQKIIIDKLLDDSQLRNLVA